MKDSLVLGLNAFGFNTSTCFLLDGIPVFAVEEERLNREKRTRRFPTQGIVRGLEYLGRDFSEIDGVAVAWNPAINLESFSTPNNEYLRYIPEALYAVPNHLIRVAGQSDSPYMSQKIHGRDGESIDIYYINHHSCHAASWYISPYDDAAVLTIDAFGEKQSTTYSHGVGRQLQYLWSQQFPHSLGSFYATFTEYCGFKPQSDEWKLMGAAPFGDSRTFAKKLTNLVELREGGFLLNLKYFNHFQFHRPHLFSNLMQDYLGLPPNTQGATLNQEYFDLAAAAQETFEKVYFHLLKNLYSQTKTNNLVISGGAALNSVANGKVTENTPFENIFVPPVPDDSGGSLGAAFYLHCGIRGHESDYRMEENYLGPEYSDEEIGEELDRYGLKFELLADPEKTAAKYIADKKIIGWFQGRLEFGDRALGNRSILGDPRDADMKDKINMSIKYRESFRPFAPAILSEFMHEYFECASPTPFMEKAFQVRSSVKHLIPAVTHVDGTGRLQTVSRNQNSRFYGVIEEFMKLTKIPIVINTSFNLRGEPIVCSPTDAIRTFYTSGLHTLFIGNYIVLK